MRGSCMANGTLPGPERRKEAWVAGKTQTRARVPGMHAWWAASGEAVERAGAAEPSLQVELQLELGVRLLVRLEFADAGDDVGEVAWSAAALAAPPPPAPPFRRRRARRGARRWRTPRLATPPPRLARRMLLGRRLLGGGGPLPAAAAVEGGVRVGGVRVGGRALLQQQPVLLEVRLDVLGASAPSAPPSASAARSPAASPRGCRARAPPRRSAGARRRSTRSAASSARSSSASASSSSSAPSPPSASASSSAGVGTGRLRRPLLRAGGWGTGDAVWRSEPLLAVRLSAETRVRCARGGGADDVAPGVGVGDGDVVVVVGVAWSSPTACDCACCCCWIAATAPAGRVERAPCACLSAEWSAAPCTACSVCMWWCCRCWSIWPMFGPPTSACACCCWKSCCCTSCWTTSWRATPACEGAAPERVSSSSSLPELCVAVENCSSAERGLGRLGRLDRGHAGLQAREELLEVEGRELAPRLVRIGHGGAWRERNCARYSAKISKASKAPNSTNFIYATCGGDRPTKNSYSGPRGNFGT